MTESMKGIEYLSKTLFIRGLQCHKSLYLYKFHPELRDEVTEEKEAQFRMGREVGVLAQQIFPTGVEIPYEGLSIPEQIEMTRERMGKGTAVLYEPAFSYNGVFIKVDILRKNQGVWEIYEVKGSTKVKDYHAYDVAVQYYVLRGLGMPVSKAFLVHLNNQYERKGDIDPHGLFTLHDLTETVAGLQDEVEERIAKMRTMLNNGEPEIDIGKQCSDPYDCDFMGHCWKHIPEESVFSLKGHGVDKFALYREGVLRLEDVPVDRLTHNQRVQLECYLERKDQVDKVAVQRFLDSIWYPLCFLDFETTHMVAIPLFDGTRPYQQIPFQFSLHIQMNPDSELEHFEYLAPPSDDPRREFVENLLKVIPKEACVLVYNATFEKRIMGALKTWFPGYKDEINAIIDNVVDLMTPFRNKSVYHWKMEGSYSIKHVLPALVPDMGYDDLEISDGATASSTWLNLRDIETEDAKQEIQRALLSYCEMDTLAMVNVLNALQRLAS